MVRLLVDEFGADTAARNSRGCTVAHWAAGGGSVEVCRFLAGERGVPFDGVRNHRGSTPLTKAVAHASAGVLDWFLHENSQSQSQSQNQNQNQKTCSTTAPQQQQPPLKEAAAAVAASVAAAFRRRQHRGRPEERARVGGGREEKQEQQSQRRLRR